MAKDKKRRIIVLDDNGGMETETFDHLSVIRASGVDAIPFLQGQLTNDFALLPTRQWQLAAYCSPKGRMLASFWGIKLDPQTVYLVLSKDIATATLKRLSMFVLRAKVTLTDATEMLPELVEQYGLAAWCKNEVARGVVRITAPLADLFVPQMLNYESIGGVSFKKGCYPGQEVVARSQFRGAIKRRTYLVKITTNEASQPVIANVGQAIYALGESESVGVLVQVEATLALICIQTSAAELTLRLGSPDGALLTIHQLPYKLLDDV